MAKKSKVFQRILELVLDKQSVEKTKKDTQDALKKGTDPKVAAKNLGVVGQSLEKVRRAALLLAAALVGALALGIRKFIQASSEQQRVTAQLEATLRSTSHAAGRTAEQLRAQADALQRLTTFSNEQVQSAQNLLLTFKQIREEELDRAVELTLDLATAMGTDAKQAALQLGKALEDPKIGMTALRRSGVSFTEQQTKTIHALVEGGRAAEAQRMILEELATQFGGSAEAARKTLGGALTGLKNNWDDLFKASSEGSAGIIDAINAISDSLPRIREFVNGFLGGIAVMGAEAAVGLAHLQVGWTRFTNLFRRGDGGARLDNALDNLERMREAAAEVISEIFAPQGTPPVLLALEGMEDAIVQTAEELRKLEDERLAMLLEATRLTVATRAETSELVQRYNAANAALKAGNLAIEDRIRLTKQLQSITAVAPALAGMTRRRTPGDPMDLGAEPLYVPPIRDTQAIAEQYRDVWLDAHRDVQSAGERAALGVAGAWQDAVEALVMEGTGLAGFMEAIFRGTAASALGALADIASAKVVENIARAFEAMGAGWAMAMLGNPAGPIAGGKSAGFHFAAAAQWAAIGGTAAAVQGAVAGGGRGGLSGGLSSGARDPVGRATDRVNRQGAEVHIHFIGPGFDAVNPEVQRVVHGATTAARERYGENARVRVHRSG